ncbi:iron chelate uptake ABC transporter family permease subunit [Arthrobacter sp. S41]|uniref:iron chelate uptake ABC transporter family permease subunit n=1 Tax=Arthrobacter sp. S41 TaxID=2509721 RepID=UPI001035F606|nr:iron chelate uptake ABC transporter family permease subunit [Arthrobacter sp. S41]TAP28570.1 Fe(3+)-siderophore ABC transporter permease [Arthrobacter sp. S41]
MSRQVALLCALAAILLLLVVASLAIGSRSLPLGSVIHALLDSEPTVERSIVVESRLPRAVLALLAGLGLGVSGVLAQSLTRNPLAEPGILGVNAGASLAIVISVGFLGIQSFSGYVFFAFIGALLTTAVVYVVGMPRPGSSDPVRLVLSGVAIGAVLTGVGTALSLVKPQAFDQLRAWTIGSLQGRDPSIILTLAGCLVVGLVLAGSSARSLDSLALGEDSARSLGTNVGRTRVLVLLAITVLAGASTAAVGAIGFIGLMAPHAARRLAGANTGWIIAFTALLAPMLLLCADMLGRVVLPGELQAGVVAAFLGAPLLIMIARGRKAVAL